MKHPAYSKLYAFYDKDWGNWSCQYIPILKKILKQLPKQSRILDIACGTGVLASKLSEMGHYVTGIDLSPQMIRCACCKNIPRTSFKVQDMRRLEIKDKYDLIINTFDAFNYMLEIKYIYSFFNKISKILDKEGFLIFDFNTEKLYINYHKGIITRDINGVVFEQYRYFDKKKNLAVTVFKFPDGSLEKHFQRAYSLENIQHIYKKNGFILNRAFGGFDYENYTENSLRCICLLNMLDEKKFMPEK